MIALRSGSSPPRRRRRPLARMEALDLVFWALRMNGVGVIEHDDRITLALLSEVDSSKARYSRTGALRLRRRGKMPEATPLGGSLATCWGGS